RINEQAFARMTSPLRVKWGATISWSGAIRRGRAGAGRSRRRGWRRATLAGFLSEADHAVGGTDIRAIAERLPGEAIRQRARPRLSAERRPQRSSTFATRRGRAPFPKRFARRKLGVRLRTRATANRSRSFARRPQGRSVRGRYGTRLVRGPLCPLLVLS